MRSKFVFTAIALACLPISSLAQERHPRPAEFLSGVKTSHAATIALSDGRVFRGAVVEKADLPWVQISYESAFLQLHSRRSLPGPPSGQLWLQVSEITSIRFHEVIEASATTEGASRDETGEGS